MRDRRAVSSAMHEPQARVGTVVLVLGDQLSAASPALAGLDPAHDRVLMIEAEGEATHVWSHKARIAIFLAAMRHFRDELRRAGHRVDYVALGDDNDNDNDADADADDERAPAGLGARLALALDRLRPARLRLLEPGEWRIEQIVQQVAAERGIALQLVDDTHFLCSRADFLRWAGGRTRRLRMEDFYRHQRTRLRILLDDDGGPVGGRWNFDSENRKGWPKSPPERAGPGLVPEPERFAPDAITRDVLALVERRFAAHPGSLEHFAWPVCRADALRALDGFIAARLPTFGEFQDAMWTATPFGWHSLLSSSLNLHLLDPREVVAAAEAACRRGDAPLASVEGFIRQIVGWREFVRGNYWRDMPRMAEANHLDAHRALPRWYWDGKTKMACTREVVRQTLRHGYAHHIQRLMVTGLFGLLAGIEPKQVADWYLAVYVDAIEWVELPNVGGMALFADGGRFTTKPYIASGAYIHRMSNYCGHCWYAPTDADAKKTGKALCPMTTLFWNFVDQQRALLQRNGRTIYMVQQLDRKSADERAVLRDRAAAMLASLDTL